MNADEFPAMAALNCETQNHDVMQKKSIKRAENIENILLMLLCF